MNHLYPAAFYRQKMFSVLQKKGGIWMLFPSFRCILQLDFCTAKSGNMTFFPSQMSSDKNLQLKGERVAKL